MGSINDVAKVRHLSALFLELGFSGGAKRAEKIACMCFAQVRVIAAVMSTLVISYRHSLV